jgi:hypothetical protein
MAATISAAQVTAREQIWSDSREGRNEAHSSGISWGAVIAGAFVAAALSLTLLALGTGIGFSAASPWAGVGTSGSAIGKSTIVWLCLTQLIAASLGGYLAGRLRTKWVNVHTHEVYFRDTAHGFLVWAVGLVLTAAFLTSAAAGMVGGATRIATAPGAPAEGSAAMGPNAYFVDTLLRSNRATPEQNEFPLRAEIAVIFANGIRLGALPPADRAYLAQIVAPRTGSSLPEAERRVDETFVHAQQNADDARRAIAHTMYWTFLALLIGAFCASYAATVGGRQRDHVPAV